MGNVFQWYKNCSATDLICSTSCSTSGGAPTKFNVKSTGSRSGGKMVKLFGRDRRFDADIPPPFKRNWWFVVMVIESSDSTDVSIFTVCYSGLAIVFNLTLIQSVAIESCRYEYLMIMIRRIHFDEIVCCLLASKNFPKTNPSSKKKHNEIEFKIRLTTQPKINRTNKSDSIAFV